MGEVLVADTVAALVSDRFTLAPAANGAYRLLAATPRTEDEAGTRPSPPEREVKTILMTDVVGSTRTVENIGDRQWGELVAEHERLTRAEIALHGGEEVDTTGDGFLVVHGVSREKIAEAASGSLTKTAPVVEGGSLFPEDAIKSSKTQVRDPSELK